MKHSNLAQKVQKARTAAALMLPAVIASVPAITSYAAEGDVTESTDVIASAVDALTTSLTSIAASIGSAIGKVLPIAIPLIGVSLVVTIGIAVFKKVASKA